MRFLSSFVITTLLALAPLSIAQGNIETVVVYVTVPPSTGSPISVASQPSPTAESAALASATPTTFATSISSSEASTLPSVTQATALVSSTSAAPASMSSEYGATGASSGGNTVDTDAGASGSDNSSFHVSKGALAAIIIVVILVALFGIVSIILFLVAKRRSWTMRQTISRASRRLTGRAGESRTNRQSRRTGLRMESPPRPGVKAVYPPGHKRGLVVDTRDVEKGPRPLDGKAPVNTRPREKSWAKKLWGGGWK